MACISVVIAFFITSSHIVLAGGLTLPVIGTIGVWGYVVVKLSYPRMPLLLFTVVLIPPLCVREGTKTGP